jgi:hypothetical protein
VRARTRSHTPSCGELSLEFSNGLNLQENFKKRGL